MPQGNLNKAELLRRILAGMAVSPWQPVLLSRKHPFEIAIRDENGEHLLRIHISNCTKRTGSRLLVCNIGSLISTRTPETRSSTIGLLLGWHEECEVFAGFDFPKYARHDRANFRAVHLDERLFLAARNNEFSALRMANDEVVFAFHPFLICDYAIHSRSLHALVSNPSDMKLLERLTQDPITLPTAEAEGASSYGGEVALRAVQERTRETNFARRVLAAYDRGCAFCGSHSGVIDTARIVPDSVDGSTDNTSNGIALCALHHRAFEAGLIYIEDDFRIRVKESSTSRLQSQSLDRDLAKFRSGLRSAIGLPAERTQRPTIQNLQLARKVRSVDPALSLKCSP